MDRYVSVGLGVLAGALLFEAALVPGIVIGGGAVLAARYLPRFGRRPVRNTTRLVQTRRVRGAPPPLRQTDAPSVLLPSGLRIKQAAAKTITFRIIVTRLYDKLCGAGRICGRGRSVDVLACGRADFLFRT